jgi:hypothetical protein
MTEPSIETARPEPIVGAKGHVRRGILMVCFGRESFRKIVLEPGRSVVIGRTEAATVRLDDAKQSARHAELWWSGSSLLVRDLDTTTGTRIDGELVPMGVVPPGGCFVAGSTMLQIFAEGATPPTEEPPTEARRAEVARLIDLLGPRDGSLYAVVDAARSDRVLRLLGESVDAHENLYEGIDGRALDDVAPYLVRFSADSQLVERLLLGGWGDAWGIFFRSHLAPKDVRRHWRRFLMAQDDDTLERFYFRFYDPRVLREFWTVATPRQRSELLDGIDVLVFEGGDGAPVVVRAADTATGSEG